jgi:hypothetical protein
MVVGIFVVLLNQVVVHVLRGQFAVEAIDIHGLEFEHDHRTGGVLGQRLIDLQRDLFTRIQLAVDEMALDEFLRYSSRHGWTYHEHHLRSCDGFS